MHRTRLLFTALLLGGSTVLLAQDFTYQPLNPAFGGNNFNYGWMLSSAQAQNGFTEEESDDFRSRFDRDPLEDFEQSLNRQVLSQLTRQLTSNQFGEGGLQEGQYEIGNYQIDVAPGAEAIQITILDISTGSQTTVSVPYF
ncbi:MAG: curli production assembly/transport component CsgF [Tunicatimonas sp.]